MELLTYEEMEDIEGGLVAGAALGTVNGFCVGLAVAFVGSLIYPDWTKEDTENCMTTGATLGAYLGGTFIPA